MGKAKSRIIARGGREKNKGIYDISLSREEAVRIAVEKIQKKEDPENIITLFGLNAEELLEGGADYESIKSLGRLFS